MKASSSSSLPLLLLVALAVAGLGDARPNIIIMQPDDLTHFTPWTPPSNPPDKSNKQYPFPQNGGNGLPNIDGLRTGGLQMMQAYAVSPVCGTSRYATITGKYPSRAASVRNSEDSSPASVTIPSTKLQDKDGQNDCSEENLAVAFRNEGYTTAMFGKWHLSKINKNKYTYEKGVEKVQECGFDHVGALYSENLGEQGTTSFFNDGSFSHNMEWVTYEAVEFIKDYAKPIEDDAPFFMYFNPTVPHGHHDIRYALTNFTCRDTADLDSDDDEDYLVKGMSDVVGGCAAYRQTIFDRAVTDDDLGSIWLDDGVGALLTALNDTGVLEDTIIIFQEDHGMGTKGSLYESGSRIPQFVHYPKEIDPPTTFDGIVTNLDIAATVFDYAGIDPPYKIDGESWRDVIKGEDAEQESYWEDERCVFFEVENDRSARCGCFKYIDILHGNSDSTTYTRGNQQGFSPSVGGNLFDLCGGGDEYVTTSSDNQEEVTIVNAEAESTLSEALACHLDRTDPDSDPDFSTCGPAAPDACKDGTDIYKFKVKNKNGKNKVKKKDCLWVAENTEERCNLKIKKGKGKKSKHVCPKSCDKCD